MTQPTIPTITLQEYKTVETDRLSPAHVTILRDHFKTYLTVQRALVGNGYLLTASHYVGVIALDDLHIVIQPKTRVQNLFYMLTYAYDLAAFRNEETLLTVGEEIFEFIVTIFLRQIQQLIRQGLHHSYLEQEDHQPYLRGRLLLAEHLRQQSLHLSHLPQRTTDYTVDVAENRILKYTLWLLAQLIYTDATLSPRLRHTYRSFAPVTHTPVTAAACRQIHFTRLNQRYRTPLNLAALLLRHLSLEGAPGHHRFGTYLFNMNELFESYVGHYLQAHFHDHPTLDVALQDHIWLDAENQEKGIPDIIIRHAGQPTYILDTKYKAFQGAPDPHDRNQLWVYAQRLKAKAAVLIYPADHLPPYATTFEGIPLRAIPLSLTGSLEAFKAHSHHFAEQFRHPPMQKADQR
jgi:5-methylcytosine-specific restriction enzyme subunit McrC